MYESWSAPHPGTSTYDNQKQWCVNKGQRLCTYSEICPGGDQTDCSSTVNPVFGTINGDQWVAFDDPSLSSNAWVQIGDGRPNLVCDTHHDGCEGHDYLPMWGADGSVYEFEAYVACCPKSIGN